MSGSAIPYHLRPHKAVDRRLFVDLLTRLERWAPLTNHAYISMGAYPLEDHKLVHRTLGITRLISFDLDSLVVARQMFNRPVDTCRCIVGTAEDVVNNIEKVLRSNGAGDATGFIVWLDYTDPKDIARQIGEFQALLQKCKPGDVIRITVNAHPNAVIDAEPRTPGHRPTPKLERQKQQFDALHKRIGDFLPVSARPEDITDEGLPLLLSRAFANAASRIMKPSMPDAVMPLSILRYADGQQMLSITCTVCDSGEQDSIWDRIQMDSWPFASRNWHTIHRLDVPTLTLRERLYLERSVAGNDAAPIIEGLGFDSVAGTDIGTLMESYRSYYRFYPTLLSADV